MMPSPLFNQLQPTMPNNPMLQRLLDFRKMVSGNPQQIIQNMLNSGRVTQSQLNQCAQRANELYRQFGKML